MPTRRMHGLVVWLLGLTALAWSTVSTAQAQTVTFSAISDAVPLKFFDPARSTPDVGNPNKLIIGLATGVDPMLFKSREFVASTTAFHYQTASDTISFLVQAPDGFSIAKVTYTQSGSGSVARSGRAGGTATWVVGDVAADLGAFGTNPNISGTVDLTGENRTLVRVSVTTSLFAFAPPLVGSATIGLTRAEVVVELLPLPSVTAGPPASSVVSAAPGISASPSPLASFVNAFYSIVLDRSADPGGARMWEEFLRTSCNAAGFDSLARGFLDSPEFRMARPLSVAGLVILLYRTFLGREPDAAGLSAWADLVRQRRLAVALQGFIPSREFRALLPDRTDPGAVEAVVTRLYTEILERQPDPVGAADWLAFVISTRDLETAAIGFLASPEFDERPLTFRDYLTILYRTFLGRQPDAAGLDAWEAVLRQALLDIVNLGFVSSPEFQAQRARLCG